MRACRRSAVRRDGAEFLAIAARTPIRTAVKPYALSQANQALDGLRGGAFEGAAVLLPDIAR
jgi:alcohol dehydrogenase, propanol-preferring